MNIFIAGIVRIQLVTWAATLLWTFSSSAQPVGDLASSALWGELEPGMWSVGFRADFVRDRTRSYYQNEDYRGRDTGHESGRPMLISIWYPSEISGSGAADRMSVGDYVDLTASSPGPEFNTRERRMLVKESLRDGPLEAFHPDGVSDDEFIRSMSTPTAAVRDLAPAAGRFPLIVHGGFSLIGQTVLLEYLASHGYVVISVPLLGTSPAWFGRGEETAEAYESGADDIGFLFAYSRSLPFVDPNKTAMIGMFSANGLVHQMRHRHLDALGVLDGRYPDVLREVPGFDPRAVRIPILEMPRTNPPDDRSMLDELRYADVLTARLTNVSHLDFYQFQRLARPGRASEHAAYRAVARTTRAFLDAVFSNDPDALANLASDTTSLDLPPDLVRLSFRPADPPVPTEREFLLLIRENRIAQAKRAWLASDCSGRLCNLSSESALTTTLLFLRRDEGAGAALPGFQLLTEMYPESERARQLLEETREMAARK
jgi:hypothetical protein